MSTTAYVDLGAVQRIESGSETPKTDYVDLGAVQRPESAAARTRVYGGFIGSGALLAGMLAALAWHAK